MFSMVLLIAISSAFVQFGCKRKPQILCLTLVINGKTNRIAAKVMKGAGFFSKGRVKMKYEQCLGKS